MLLDERQYAEKRDFIRMFVDSHVEVVDEETGATFHGDGKNISGSGLMFIADFQPREGASLHVTVSSLQSRLPPLQAQFRVIRVSRCEDGRYQIGGELSDIR